MSLSRRSVVMLLDLIENKLACMQVLDREDARELATIEQARREILAMPEARRGGQVIPLRRVPSDVEEAMGA